ncbi:ADP-ribosylation factor-binding protein GGA1 isoform X2 [Photinus pyralis]|uniref:ADP-ribosylation factor-binding protein GGA1 n=1 Tax=Photinus pyralis TaxID=7054 RepID=A0A1Y1LBZ0_PHOPY|nr:ADP-ribosylation factor-binding protein GGA1 isoform X2 [Photinus pyralis]
MINLSNKATNTQSQNVDTAAVEAFCALINKEKEGPPIGAKLLANRMHSKNETEALHTLTILDTSMKRCNNSLHSEIGKFRFLNEMIKLVSPKYLGSQTPISIKQKVLQLLYIWTLDYPKETKIKEAYDMLKKQGVIREVPLSVCADNATLPERKLGNSIFNDEEKNRLLQKLLQSKNPEDLQAANRLIKNMVKEDDKRAELKSRRVIELESVHNNVRLLNEMLDSYKPGISSEDELQLIKELHQSCERLRPSVFKLATDVQQNEEMLNEVLHASDELGQVFDKFTEIIIKGNIPQQEVQSSNLSLLDLADESTSNSNNVALQSQVSNESQSDMDLLCDIFTSNIVTDQDDILKPISTLKNTSLEETIHAKSSKTSALDELDALGEHLLKENLSSQRSSTQFNKVTEKVSMNVLARQSSLENKNTNSLTEQSKLTDLVDAFKLDLNFLTKTDCNATDSMASQNRDLNGDDVLVDITCDKKEQSEPIVKEEVTSTIIESKSLTKTDFKLNDLFVKLEEIKPSSLMPLVVLDEKNGITVTFHFGKNKPREDVTVIVVTTISKNELPLSNLLFQAVVPKNCKLKLQKPSGTELPSHNPFLPPSAVTQVMLIANPEKIKICLKFIVSYTMDDETFTEMGEVESLPVTE